MYSMTIDEAMYTTSTILAEKELSLLERFKQYFSENSETIYAGLAAMNGSFYMPTKRY